MHDLPATVRLLRPHHWLKNTLVLVPLLWAGEDGREMWWPAMGAFLAFCVAASQVYVLNDLVDLERDRRHARKRHRPLASGAISTGKAVALIPVLLLLLVLICRYVPAGLRDWLWLYLGIANGYTVLLKRWAGIDILTIGFLYILRLEAGGELLSVNVPALWLAFSFFLFLSLALLKRYADLPGVGANGGAEVYGRRHLRMLVACGAGSGLVSACVLGMGLADPGVWERYRDSTFPCVLWCIFVLWMGRLWWLAVRAEVAPDPFPFALRDWMSYATAGLALWILVYARY